MEVLDPSVARAVIRAQFPHIAPASVAYLGGGYDSTAFEVDGTWVFRFPKRQDVERQLLIERRVLPVLAERCPVPMPRYELLGQPSAAFPLHFAAYPKLPGQPAIQAEWSSEALTRVGPRVASFLRWLHAFPAAEAARLGVARVNLAETLEEVQAEALDDFGLLDRVAPDSPLAEWLAYLKAPPPLPSPRTALVHYDFAAEHVLCDPATRSVTGVIDWSDMALADPAIDLAGLMHWGGDGLLDVFLQTYGAVDPPVIAMSRFLAACRGVGDVVFGVARQRPEYVRAGLRALEYSSDRLRRR